MQLIVEAIVLWGAKAGNGSPGGVWELRAALLDDLLGVLD